MIHRGLILIACVSCGLVLLSFVMFARDQVAASSEHQQSAIALGHSPSSTPIVTKPHEQPRRFIDDAASKLESPFRSLVQSDSQWVVHGLPAVFALLVYGVGLGYLARFASGNAGRHHLGHSPYKL